jgi:hypothetical protein
MMFGSIGGPELLFLAFPILGSTVVLVWPGWRILKKVGLPPALSLIALLPFGFIAVFYIAAFSGRHEAALS